MDSTFIPEGYNHLYNSKSPYLLQHATNPVNWYPWGDEAMNKARKEDKPILVSIGYSSCHWCHVMERESFVNDSIAALMNAHFVCIKVDREERPDIDQIYMDAVQSLGLQGGWPLNVFLTSAAKPFYGGTYFPPAQWSRVLQGVNKAYETKRDEIQGTADQLADALSTSEILRLKLGRNPADFNPERMNSMFDQISAQFDVEKGGLRRAPKFPMPSIWNFLLKYQDIHKHRGMEQINKTLSAMALGGLYDQIGGGFARYSTDADWLVPHFEKMLYDNAQLISIYSNAWKMTPDPLYKEVVAQTVAWAEREMMNDDGGFYAALDADSEGEEGKYYVWKKTEFDKILGEDSELMKAYYNVTDTGNWEEEKNILHRRQSDSAFIKEHDLDPGKFQQVKSSSIRRLFAQRSERVEPGLDNKTLAAWNGLMLRALTDAYASFGDEHYLLLARKNANFITTKLMKDEKLFRSLPDEHSQINGFLDDYAFVIDGLLQLYQISLEEHWLTTAEKLMETALTTFFDKKEDMFYYSSDKQLIAQKKELFDNVIPSSNSQMGINLYFLGLILDKEEYLTIAKNMLSRFTPMLDQYARDASNWAIFYFYMSTPTVEIAVVGPGAKTTVLELASHAIPNKVLLGTREDSSLPLLKGKETTGGGTTIYVCYDKTCKLPVNKVSEALEQIQ